SKGAMAGEDVRRRSAHAGLRCGGTKGQWNGPGGLRIVPRDRRATAHCVRGGGSMRFRSAGLGAAVGLAAGGPVVPAVSQGILKTGRLSAVLAHEAVTTAVATCTAQDQQVSAVVIDAAGAQQAFLRGDGAGIHTVETADYKAYTALSFRTDGID